MELAKITDGKLVIEFTKKDLAQHAKGAFDAGYIDFQIRVTDPDLFMLEFVRALNTESEDGTTLVHKMMDEALSDMAEGGAEGFDVKGVEY